MNDEYHQTNSQLDHHATPKRESGDGPGQEGSEYVDPSQGEYDQVGELKEVRKVTPNSEYSDTPSAGPAYKYIDPGRGEYSQADQKEQRWNTISKAEYNGRPSDNNDPGTNVKVSPQTYGNYNSHNDGAR